MYRQGSRREPRLPEQFSMRSPDAHSRSDLTWGGTRALGPFPVTTRDVTVVSSRPHPPSPATRDAHSEDADRGARKRKRERARTAQYLRPAQVPGTSAVGRAEWQYGRTARCTPGPPGVDALGQVDFGNSVRGTLAPNARVFPLAPAQVTYLLTYLLETFA